MSCTCLSSLAKCNVRCLSIEEQNPRPPISGLTLGAIRPHTFAIFNGSLDQQIDGKPCGPGGLEPRASCVKGLRALNPPCVGHLLLLQPKRLLLLHAAACWYKSCEALC